jgi:hypothetical protein
VSRPAEAPDPGRNHSGIAGDFISERWRNYLGMVGDIIPESWAASTGIGKSPQDPQLEVLPDGGCYMSQVVDLASVRVRRGRTPFKAKAREHRSLICNPTERRVWLKIASEPSSAFLPSLTRLFHCLGCIQECSTECVPSGWDVRVIGCFHFSCQMRSEFGPTLGLAGPIKFHPARPFCCPWGK